MKKFVFALLMGLSLGLAGIVFAASDENGQYIQGTPYVEGDVYHIDCFGDGAYYVFAGSTHQCDGDNDITLSQSPNNAADSWNLDIYNFQTNTSQGQVIPYENRAIRVYSTSQYEHIQKPMKLQTPVSEIMGNIIGSIGALLGLVAIVCSFPFGIKLIKKAFPNAY